MNLSAEHVFLGYGAQPVLRDVSLTLKAGEMVFLLGVNGAGKSTLLKALAGFLRPQSGSISCGGVELYQMPPRLRARQAAYLGQHTPAADMTVLEYILLGAAPYLSFGAVPGKRWEERAMAVMEQLDLAGFAARSMDQISGGERQRGDFLQGKLSAPGIRHTAIQLHGIRGQPAGGAAGMPQKRGTGERIPVLQERV